METSEKIDLITTSLKQFQSKIVPIVKDATNPFFKSKYASLSTIIETIRQPLSECSLSFTQFPTGDNELVTVLFHISGQYIKATAKMTPKENTPQAQGSAITYMRRYALSAMLGLATEDDDDGNAASKTVKSDVATQASVLIDNASSLENLQALNDKVIASKQLTKAQKETLKKKITEKLNELSTNTA